MKQIVVFVPGVMGSRLVDEKNNQELWGEDIRNSFNSFTKKSGLLKVPPPWTEPGAIRATAIIDKVTLLGIPFGKIYEKLLSRINDLSSSANFEFVSFPYDWRRDIRSTSDLLSQMLSSLTSKNPEVPTEFTIVGHSMGCLLSAMAILNCDLESIRIRGLVMIAPPFLGSPSAFIALYHSGYLPGLDFLERALGFRRDRLTRVSNMLQTCQSFPSLYQLLPHANNKYLYLPKGDLANPLIDDEVIPEWARESAEAVHSAMSKLPEFVVSNAIPHILISGIANKSAIQLKPKGVPEARHNPNLKYPTTTANSLSATYGSNVTNERVYTSVTVESLTAGDGTVPIASSRFENIDSAKHLNLVELDGLKHVKICEDERVIELVVQYLPFLSSKPAVA